MCDTSIINKQSCRYKLGALFPTQHTWNKNDKNSVRARRCPWKEFARDSVPNELVRNGFARLARCLRSISQTDSSKYTSLHEPIIVEMPERAVHSKFLFLIAEEQELWKFIKL